MAKKKSNKARGQRRRDEKALRRRKKRAVAKAQGAGSPARPSKPARAARAAPGGAPLLPPPPPRPPMQDEYELQGDLPEGGLHLDPHGRLARIEDRKLKVLLADEAESIGHNVPLDGSFCGFDLPLTAGNLHVLQEPAIRDGAATMQVGVRGASDSECDGLLWNPTYTAKVQWGPYPDGDEGEWVFTVVQDAFPLDPVGRCGMGPDGTDDFWEGAGDPTSELAVDFAADHLDTLLRLARSLTAQA